MTRVKKPRTRQPQQRRTQAERRDDTRKRLVEATLHCLKTYGYAGTAIEPILKHARVSRGGWGHHYASKSALILDAAQYLMQRVYDRLASLMLDTSAAQGAVQDVMRRIWSEFFESEVNEIYLELLIASRRDKKLAKTLASLWQPLATLAAKTSERYFEPTPKAVGNVGEMILIMRWAMRGMVLDAHLITEDGILERHLQVLGNLLATQLRPRDPAPQAA